MNEDNRQAELELLLDHLRRGRGFDFTGYKRASLERRVSKRLGAVGVESFLDYLWYTEEHPDEVDVLFNTILINVTAFFRDPSAWEAVKSQILPRVVAAKRPDEPIRVWTAGCSSGEEAYTLAMILAEVLGQEKMRERVKIYATDVDREALVRARHAVYSAREVLSVPPDCLDRYFEHSGGRYTFKKDFRRSVIFGRHDLIQDVPISRIDLLSCRNTLMYLKAETQARVLEHFHFSLNDRGYMLLGKAETLLTYNSSFVPFDLKRRIFSKVSRGSPRERLFPLGRDVHDQSIDPESLRSAVRDFAFAAAPVAQVVVGASGELLLANELARAQFGINAVDLGRPLHELRVSYRPVELRTGIDRAYAERRPVVVSDVEWMNPASGVCYLEVSIVPLYDPSGVSMGVSITFLDTTPARRLREELQNSNRELEAAYEELQSTNEELETTNEELQSTVEELETTNEELQSTNEDLETMNEELQSTNDELQSVNSEARAGRGAEARQRVPRGDARQPARRRRDDRRRLRGPALE